MLLNAFAGFAQHHPEYTLSIYGDGALREELTRLRDTLGLQDKVFFHGNVEHIHREIADAEMFVLSSDYEGLSNALLECMMMGIPCISTSVEGSVDVIQNGVNGLLVKVGETEELTQAMLHLAEDPLLRDRLHREGQKSAERFKQEKVLKQWMELLE